MKKFLLCVAMLATALYANTLEEIKEKGVIRIGVLNDQAPFSTHIDGEYQGFEIDMAKAVTKEIFGDAVKIEWVGFDNLEDRITYLEQNKVDLDIANFTKTEERGKRIDFCNPYFSIGLGLLVNKGSTIQQPKDLTGLKIAVQGNSTGEMYLNERGDATIVAVDKSNEAYDLLKQGKVDGYLNNSLTVMVYPILDDKVTVPKTMRRIGSFGYLCPAVAKDNVELREAVNKAMVTLSKTRFMRGIYEETFGVFYRGEADPDSFLLEELYRMYN